MILNCSFSGDPCEKPVIDVKTGKIYNLPSILPHIGTQPGHLPDAADTLIPVAGADPAIPPRLPTATSLPSMLSLFQQEWDAVLLQLHLQSKRMHETGMELAVSLYENDAAKRVISRLLKERDDARRELEERAGGVPVTKKRAAEPVEKSPKKAKVADDAMEIDSILDASVVEILDSTAKVLSAARRKRKTPAALVDGEKRMAGFTVAKLDTSHAGGSPTSKNGGIIVFQSFQGTLFENEVVLLAGGSKDGKITIRRMEGAGESTQILTSKAHKKDVTALAWGVDGTLLTGGVDGKIKTWLVSEGKKDITWKEIKAHALDTPILSLSIHPSGKLYLACTSTSWILIDIETGDVIATVDAKNESEFTMARFHPDGLILAIGCAAESAVEIYDIKSLDLVTRFKADGESTAVTSLEFSENGYFLASATASAVHIWDLRSQALYAEIKPPVEADDTGDFRVQWDGFGAYLAVFGRGKQAFVWRNKQWKEDPVAAWDIGARGLGCAFTGDAEMVVFAGSDGKYSVLS